MPRLRVAVNGAGGRMGKTIVRLLAECEETELVAAYDHTENVMIGAPVAGTPDTVLQGSDDFSARDFEVLIDFSTPESAISVLEQCAVAGRGAVIGTTGFSEQQHERMRALAEKSPMVYSPNMSVGVNLCYALVALAAKAIGSEADVEIFEAHHRHKVDAPSGTALRLGEIVAERLGLSPEKDFVHTRVGVTGPRPRQAVGFQVMRAGDIVGEHTVTFALAGERVEITHKASSRDCFARGAVRAALWVRDRAPGLYAIGDVLGLSVSTDINSSQPPGVRSQ